MTFGACFLCKIKSSLMAGACGHHCLAHGDIRDSCSTCDLFIPPHNPEKQVARLAHFFTLQVLAALKYILSE